METSAKRCGTDQMGVTADRLPLKRADALSLGDLVLFANWNGTEVREVVALAWEGEDVALTLRSVGADFPADNVEASTSPGNTFRVLF